VRVVIAYLAMYINKYSNPLQSLGD
jgi:hypothetical protein